MRAQLQSYILCKSSCGVFTFPTQDTHTENKSKNAQDDVTVWMMLLCLWEVRMKKKKKTSKSEEIKQINITERVSGDLVYLGSRWLL